MIATRPNATGVPCCTQRLPCEPESARHVRRLVDTALNTWGLVHLIEDGLLIVSELVGNAVQHSGGSVIVVNISLTTPERVRVSVSDASTEAPAPRTTGHEEESGRGLFLVHALANCWGSEYGPFGKAVWAELLSTNGTG
ncbi:ATP-binding protein [Streptomyces sp. NPDC054796]